MKTYPILNSKGDLAGFEITSAWITFKPIYRILKSIDGVKDIKRQLFSEDHMVFTFRGNNCVINESYGDNSRFWIGLNQIDKDIDITPIHKAFQEYQNPIIRIINRIRIGIKANKTKS
jgi:hypothetical protein